VNDSDDDVVAVAPPIVSATSRRSGVRRQAAGGRRCRLPHAHGRRREVVSFEPLPSARQQCADSANGRKMEGSRRRSGHWLHSRPCPSQDTTGRWTFLRARRTVRRTGPEVWQGGSKRDRAPPGPAAACRLGCGRGDRSGSRPFSMHRQWKPPSDKLAWLETVSPIVADRP